MTTDDILKIALRRWKIILASLLVGIGVAAVLTLVQTPQYTSSATGFVTAGPADTTGDAFTGTMLAQRKAEAYVPLVTSRAVAAQVIEELGLEATPQSLASRLTAALPNDGVTITVSATAGSPEEAQRIADAVVRVTATEAARIDGSEQGTGVSLVPVESALLPTRPSSPNPERNIALGALLGLLAGFGIAVFRQQRDTRIRSPKALEENGLSTLGTIPRSSEIAGRHGEDLLHDVRDFHTREALRQLRTNLRFVDVDNPPRIIVVTSARMNEGKSTVAAHLAGVLAASGQAAILVDADLRRPSVATMFDLDATVGLTQVLAGSVPLEVALNATGLPHLQVLTSGQIPPNPSELVGSQRMAALLRKLATGAMVIVDAPPLLPVTDAALLTASADGALLVVSAGETRQEHIQQAMAAISNVNGHLLGAVLNRVTTNKIGRIVGGEDEYGYDAYEPYELARSTSRSS